MINFNCLEFNNIKSIIRKTYNNKSKIDEISLALGVIVTFGIAYEAYGWYSKNYLNKKEVAQIKEAHDQEAPLNGLEAPNQQLSDPTGYLQDHLERIALDKLSKKKEEEKHLKAKEAMVYKTLPSLPNQIAKQKGKGNPNTKPLFIPNSSNTIFSKINNYFNPFMYFFSFINNHSILKIPKQPWPAEMARRRHDIFYIIGAEQLILESKQGDFIDATFISVQNFLNSMENLGGKRFFLKAKLKSDNAHNSIPIQVQSDLGVCNGLMIPYQPEFFDNDQDQKLISFYKKQGMVVLDLNEEKEPGGLLLVKIEHKAYIDRKNHPCIKEILPSKSEEGKAIFSAFGLDGQIIDRVVRGIYFKNKGLYVDVIDQEEIHGKTVTRTFKGVKNLPAIQYIYEKFELAKTQWQLRIIGNDFYLVQNEDVDFLTFWLNRETSNQKNSQLDQVEVQKMRDENFACAILSMNQTAAYQQSTAEMIALLLEGLHVAAYNNSGKGLSVGKNATPNIDAAIEVVYQFLQKNKGIPDHKIIAKGQCFGAAPTCKLLELHPQVNAWIDQAPSNFIDVIIATMKKKLPALKLKTTNEAGLKNKFLFKIYCILEKKPQLITMFIPGYNNAASLKTNKGHKLVTINVKDANGFGGDELVPPEHDELFKIAISGNSKKESKLVLIPGGVHVTTWCRSKECYKEVVDFLKKTELAVDFFVNSTQGTRKLSS